MVYVNDPIGDMLARIRNAHMRGSASARAPYSMMRERVLRVLRKEGYIDGFSKSEDERPILKIDLKYHGGKPVISHIRRVSKPGRRVYAAVRDIPLVRNGLGIAILSTPRGVMSDSEARQANSGGEILCEVS